MNEREWAQAISSGEDTEVRGGLVYCDQGHPPVPNGEPCGPCLDELDAAADAAMFGALVLKGASER